MARRVIVVGAGASGLIAAGRAAELGAQVVLLDKMAEAGKKILISGKSRCNITNAAPLTEFLSYYGPKGRFLTNAFHRFFRDELLALLGRYGVETQTERGGRIFPTSGQASDVRDALLRYAVDHGAQVRYQTEVNAVSAPDGRVEGVDVSRGGHLPADAVILATGGASWPDTGSTGYGYVIAQTLGHTIEPLRAALVPLTVAERATAKALQGVSLRNVSCTFLKRAAESQKAGGRETKLRIPYPLPDTGELLFTHFGVSGPLILSASMVVVDALRAGYEVFLSIDLKPGMTEEEVHARLQRSSRPIHTSNCRRFPGLGPSDAGGCACRPQPDRAGAPCPPHPRRRARKISSVCSKTSRWTLTGSFPIAAGMVTAGGVSLKEVDPVTFESRKVRGLYIVGELLDLAADTGGSNLRGCFQHWLPRRRRRCSARHLTPDLICPWRRRRRPVGGPLLPPAAPDGRGTQRGLRWFTTADPPLGVDFAFQPFCWGTQRGPLC